ncbi:HEAT repeat domain-containing protein [Paenibacillus aquistagni]|uniref:HEAT repeat-containing protein n=1 Tax=Paenibacillus aquistagni TaxID=1852522 RepID=A0A1X7J2J0_9BACL|nr:HEAT repeat domain-containing protein [Paenibacillus aquistagni]SMG21558.1 HEAT repeat-containing protein [Paenibacillus aquistagni]
MNQASLLTDEQMVQFITEGYLVLANELPEQLHQEVMDNIYHALHEEGNPGNNILPRVPKIMEFFDTAVVKGALTSILGPDYYMHPHRHCHYNQPGNQQPGGGKWHKDGYWSAMRSHRPWWAMIFYYTQDITEELGPTAVMPGTQYYEKFIGERGRTILPTGKAGTMVLVHFDLWHRASLNISNLDRYMLKFQFVRLQAPTQANWNHQEKDMVVPQHIKDGVPYEHLHIWQDTWNWLRGEAKTLSEGSALIERIHLSSLEKDLDSDDNAALCRAIGQTLEYGEAAVCIAPVLGELLRESEPVALNAAYALAQMGTSGVEVLINQLRTGTKQVAERAAYGLQSAASAAVPALREVLVHPDEHRRALAAYVLGMIGPAACEAVPCLIAQLQDDSEWVKRNIVEALGMIGNVNGEVVSGICSVLEEAIRSEAALVDVKHDMQSYIINKLGYTAALALLRTGRDGDSMQIVKALEQALNSKDRYVRAYASEALTHLSTPEAIKALIGYYRTARWCPDTSKASTF